MKHLFFIKITAVILLSLLGAWLFVSGLYFSAALVLLGIIALAISIYFDRKKLIGKMERMIAGIRNSDFSFHFTNSDSKDEIARLSQEMNEALEAFRSRTHDSFMDEAETEAWQKLISVLTHEIMNSIAPIISLSETLSEENEQNTFSDEDYRVMKQAMQTIHRRGKGLLSFVENYRKLTKIPEPLVQPIRVSAMLESLQRLVASDGIRFSFTCYPEHLILLADRNMLDQILINLLKNAKEASLHLAAPEINVKAAQVGDEVQIEVHDNGSGISADAMDKIFIPFFSTKTTGSGIGLSLTRQMMIRHKGRISVKSDESGSRFTLVFPK